MDEGDYPHNHIDPQPDPAGSGQSFSKPSSADSISPAGQASGANAEEVQHKEQSTEPHSYAPRPAKKALQLPDASDHDHLRQATAEIVQYNTSITDAAKKFDVDPDTLFIWHRTYVNFVGKDLAALSQTRPNERTDFDRETSRKFDHNWAEMLHEWELSRPQLSPTRKKLLASPFTRWMFRGERVDTVTLAGAGAAIAFSALAIRASTINQGQQDPGQNPNSPASLTEVDPTDPDSIVGDSQAAVLAKVAKALEKFATLENWQQRLAFVRSPEKMKPLMEDYYRTHPDGPLKKLVINPQVSFLNREDKVFVLLQARHTPDDTDDFAEPEPIIFLAEARDGEPEFLFDWEVMVNYEPKPWEEFAEQKSTTPATFRMRVAKGDYFNQPFMDAEKFNSYTLTPLHREERAYGFVEKNSPIAKELEENLAKELNQNRAMILKVSFPKGAKFNNIVKIEEITADGWLEE